MALTKTSVQVNFAQGVDGKTDPYQVSVGKFLTLTNSVFTTAGRLTKRNGFGLITELPNTNQTTLSTLNDNLIATGTNLYAFSEETDQWLNQGNIQPIDLETISLVKNSLNQSSPDIAVAPNGLACLVYTQSSLAYYQIFDSLTGQQIVGTTALPSTAVCPRAYTLGNYFIVTFLDTVSASTHLQYIAIPITSPSTPGTPQDLANNVLSLSSGYDCIVANSNLYFAFEGSASTIKVGYLTSHFIVSSVVPLTTNSATLVTLAVDSGTQTVFVAWYDSSGAPTTSGTHAAAFDYFLNQKMAVTTLSVPAVLIEMTSVAENGTLYLFEEVPNNYSYLIGGSTVPSDYVQTESVALPASGTGTGTAVAATVMLRGVGLASKSFIGSDGKTYMLVVYGDNAQVVTPQLSNQSTYFLVDSTGNVYLRLAYSNAGGYANNQVLPNVVSLGDQYLFPYLHTDFLATINKTTSTSTAPTNAIYTNFGISLAQIMLVSKQFSTEIASQLNLTGGLLWSYDTVKPVENNFNVFPENIGIVGTATAGNLVVGVTYFWQFCYEWTNNQGNLERSAPSIPVSFTPTTAGSTFSGNVTSGSPIVTSVSSFTGLQVGQQVTGTFVPGRKILSLNPGAGTLTMTGNATGGSSSSTVLTPATATAVALVVPELRQTYKNNVRIVGYRYSSAQPVYYQFTSLTSPTLNNPLADSVTIPDLNSDASILGNVILYTTGGVVENIAAPACADIAAFKSRVMLVDAEDRNLIWFSKQVIEAVPVEFSDLFTIYVAPTIGAQGSTGPITAISAMDDKFIVFKKDAIYYITGNGPDNTGNNNDFSDPIFITSSVGCTIPDSIVLMKDGIMFQSDKGIWLLGRDLSTQYIGAPVENVTNVATVKSSTNIPGTTQVRFVMSNNVILMYDYFYAQWGTFDTIQATAATLYQNQHTYLNQFGQVFQETAGTYLDGSKPVLMSFTTSWFNVAGLRGFERFYFGFLLGTYFTPFKLALTLAYDYLSSAKQQIIITPDNAVPDFGDESVWGGGGPWGGPGNVFQARFFPMKQKCQTFQISVQEIYDPSLGQAAGQGLSLSGMNIVIGAKKGYSTQKAGRSFG